LRGEEGCIHICLRDNASAYHTAPVKKPPHLWQGGVRVPKKEEEPGRSALGAHDIMIRKLLQDTTTILLYISSHKALSEESKHPYHLVFLPCFFHLPIFIFMFIFIFIALHRRRRKNKVQRRCGWCMYVCMKPCHAKRQASLHPHTSPMAP
jgi:hypothetical protein